MLAAASLAVADSNPSWWLYASPDATALVGIQWENLRNSPLADALTLELGSQDGLGFPPLDCLLQARQFVISSPPLLAMASGAFPAATVKEQAARAGMHGIKYKSVALWLPRKPADPGLAQISNQLLLIGSMKTLEAAIDNSLAENARRYSPLLARAARYSQTADLWVVSSRLPDPLANRFVPIDGAALSFEGAVSLRNGLELEAWLDAESPGSGAALAQAIRKASAGFPEFARGMDVPEGAGKVALTLRLSSEEFAAAFPPAPAQSAAEVAKSAAVPAPEPPARVLKTRPPEVARAEPAPAAAPIAPAGSSSPPQPMVIRILGLEDGVREIPFPSNP